ncbi:uncharacterized protein LOC135199099 [Macrobrachium nipponense]|uniref:uncharacterized protein LOC135199099 n=1 Tax=Macrobrachium nipponense TaxID=159736 RepID=UPI0030C7B558
MSLLSKKLGLDYKSSLVGLGFDGASVMSGGISGVQKRIKEKALFAYYVHCCGHKLNLVLTSVAKNVPQASEFFSLLEEVYIFASNAVVHEKFLSIQREMFPEEHIREFQHLSDTRWWCQATSCDDALLRLECIIRLLKETSADDTGARAVSARGLLAQMDPEFVCLLQFFSEILGKINKVSHWLQDKQADLGKAAKLISCLREDLADVRNSNLIENYSNMVDELSVTLPVTSASCERCFSKMKIVKTFLRNSMTSERLSNTALLSVESKRAESIDLDSFVDEFDSRHDNCRIKLH